MAQIYWELTTRYGCDSCGWNDGSDLTISLDYIHNHAMTCDHRIWLGFVYRIWLNRKFRSRRTPAFVVANKGVSLDLPRINQETRGYCVGQGLTQAAIVWYEWAIKSGGS